MLYFIYKNMIINQFTYTTNLQQKHNKFYFVAKVDNGQNFCCGFVATVTFSFTEI